MDQIPVFIPHLSAVHFHGKQTARFHRLHPFIFTVSRLLQSGGDLIAVLLGSPVRYQVACQQDRADAREQLREPVDPPPRPSKPVTRLPVSRASTAAGLRTPPLLVPASTMPTLSASPMASALALVHFRSAESPMPRSRAALVMFSVD